MEISSKVIRASAGTGKTYRLSLEFIDILLQNRDNIEFDEILVITFTRKATFEIKERIFSHLAKICSNKGQEIITNLKLIDPVLEIGKEEIVYLNQVYRKMLINKSRLNVSTIDSFTTKIFTNLIAPYLQIDNIRIDPQINETYLPEILDKIISKTNLQKFINLFASIRSKNLKKINDLVTEILRMRWLIEGFAGDVSFEIDLKKEQKETFSTYQLSLSKYLTEIQSNLIILSEKDPSKEEINSFFKSKIHDMITSRINLADIKSVDIKNKLSTFFLNKKFLHNHFKTILSDQYFWNGNKYFNKKEDDDIKNELIKLENKMKTALADWLFYDRLLPEMKALIDLSKLIYLSYNRIKFRDKIFTYDDLTFYTHKYLYDPEISIIDPDNVLNLFYEFLSYRFRYILIDEFQDTSIMQWNIISPLISEIISGTGQKDYGGMIIVGDEKQSIYGWRGGEKALLEECAKLHLAEDIKISLNKTYRCGKNIQDFINGIFSNPYLHNALDFHGVGWYYEPISSAYPEKPGYTQVNIVNQSDLKEDKEINSNLLIYRDFVDNIVLPMIGSGEISPVRTAVIARKNKELSDLATILEEYGIDFILESTASVFEHRAVKPILYLLRFLAYTDYHELVKFLRSDLVLISTQDLKDFLVIFRKEGYPNYIKQDGIPDIFSNIEHINKLKHSSSILVLTKEILERFGVLRTFSLELDVKNINRFLEIVADFELSNRDHSSNLEGFIRYCTENESKEEFTQVGISESNSINLLTIHKAKGLEFDNVFFLQDLNIRFGSNHEGLYQASRYDEPYRNLNELILTYNYRKVLENSRFGNLAREMELNQTMEELNNIYVGITRAKSGLIVYYHYNNKKDLPDYIEYLEKKKDIKTHEIFFLSLYDYLKGKLIHENSAWSYKTGDHKIESTNEKSNLKSIKISPELKDNFGIMTNKDLKPNQNIVSLKELSYQYLTGKNLLIGNIAHYYLSEIRFDTQQNRKKSKYNTISKYGTLLNDSQLDNLISCLEDFLNNNRDIFSSENWDEIYNEYPIFDDKGNEFRIDRLMINKKNKLITIIDYKTGSIRDSMQLEMYKKIIANLDYVRDKKYRIETCYKQIDLNI